MKKRFGFLVYDGVEELDLTGPWEMVGLWRDFAEGPDLLIVGNQLGVVTCSKGLRIQVDVDYASCPSLNYLLIPGGKGSRLERYNHSTLEFIQKYYLLCEYMLSVCTGFLILVETGIMHDKKATTYHLMVEELKHLPKIHLSPARYQQDGKVWTSAGVSAGIDMILAFIAQVAGKEVAGQIQYLSEYYPEQVYYPTQQPLPEYIKPKK